MTTPPWATGPAEILQHGMGLLAENGDSARRLAMISIDNAVELTIRTYLGLPKRVTGVTLSRRKFAEISESFPDMLDALEEHANAALGGIDLGEIEWFHRLRNELYHNGNGLTIERRHVEVYSEIAKLLWERLLGGPEEEAPEVPAPAVEDQQAVLLGQFIRIWGDVEKAIQDILAAEAGGTLPPGAREGGARVLRLLAWGGLVPDSLVAEATELQRVRNEVVHSQPGARRIQPDDLARALKLANDLQAIARSRGGHTGAT